eukprot:422043_1
MGADADRLWHRQLGVIIFTYFSYAGLNACRKGFAYAKDSMHHNWDMSEYWQGAFDGTLMFSYSIGLYISGRIGDKFNVSYCLGWGLFWTGFLNIFFSLSYPYFDMSISENGFYYLCIWVLNGLAQSICWPTSIRLIGNWISLNPNAMLKTYSKSGLIFGLWSSCQSFGNILGAIAVTFTISNNLDIQYSFFITGFYTIIMGISILFLIPAKPDINLINAAAAEVTQQDENPKNELIQLNKSQAGYTDNTIDENEEEKDDFNDEFTQLSYIQIILLPGVLTYMLSFSCLKALNYTLFFWLPLYLDDMLSSTIIADNISMTFDVGQIIGGIIIGLLSDKILRRSPILFISMFIATIPVFFFSIDSNNIFVLLCLCFFSGLFIGGPYNLIPSAIAQDLSQISQLKGNRSAIATIAGLINGTGSFASALLQFIVPVILGGKQTDQSWTSLFVVLGFVSLIGTFVLIKLVINDMRFIQSYPVNLKQRMTRTFSRLSTFRLFRQLP